MKKRKVIIIAIPVIIILTLVIFIIISKKQAEFLYCSPAIPRGNDLAKWQETITPKSQNSQFDNEFLNKFKVSSDIEKYTVKYPDISFPDDPFAFELHELILGQPFEIGGGTLEFLGLGVVFPDVNHISNDDVPYKFFDANFQPEKTKNYDDFWTYEKYERDSIFQTYPWPFVQFAFEYQGIEDVMFNGIKVFDARTHKLLSSGFSSGGPHPDEWTGHQFKVNMPLWHHAPIDLVIDISFGPSKTFEFPPQAGEGFNYEGFECRFISVFEDVVPYDHRSSSSNNMAVIELPKATQGDGGLCFFFACQPAANQMPLTLSFFDKDGKRLQNGGSSTSAYTHKIRLQQPLEKVALIQAKYRTNRYRIIIHLPYIPGLPEQNRNINNLFDVYIPYVKFNDESRLNRFLYETLQLEHSQGTGQRPADSIYNASFPIELRGVTVHDIAKLYSAGGSLNVNIEDDRLELKYPVPFLTKIKMLFQKLHQNE